MFSIAFVVLACLQGLAYAQLPDYNGVYGVGYMTIEVPVIARQIAPQRITANARAAFSLESVLFNIYYPADKNNQSTKASPPWIQNLSLISQGIAAGTNGTVDAGLVSLGLSSLAGAAVIPAYTDVPITGDGPYPVYVFSHGDTSLPEWYSHFLGSIAADGNVVVAITHRDGSNAGSQVIINGRPTRNVTYITPDMLTPTVNATGLAMIERQFREAEVEDVITVLGQINDGQGDQVYGNNSRGDGEDLKNWGGKFDLKNNLVAGGHSFGATSSLDTIQARNVSGYNIRAGLVLDPGKESGPLSTNIQAPILIADSQNWTETPSDLYGQDHFTVVKGIAETSLKASNAGWFMTLLGTAHVSITDAGLIAGVSLLSLFDSGAANATLPPVTAIDQYVDASVQFFRYLRNGTVGDILSLNASDPVYTPRAANSSTPGDEASYWEVHVAPVSNGTATTGGGSGSGTSSGSGASSTSSQGSGAIHNMGVSVLAVLCVCIAALSPSW